MTEKQLDEGRMLLDQIKRLRSEREKWEKMIGFDRVEIKIANPLRGCKYDVVVVNPLFLDFETIRTFTLAKIDESLKGLCQKFDAL